MRPLIIDFEGLDGSGKTTHAVRTAERLAVEGRHVTLLKFPDHTSITGKYIRSHLARSWRCEPSEAQEHLDAGVFQCLQVVNRLEQLPDKAWAGTDVDESQVLVTDRLYLSGIVYGLCDGLDRDWLLKIGRAIPKPDILFYLDVSPKKAIERISKRLVLERYEEECVKIVGKLEQLRKTFFQEIMALSEEHWTKVFMINASDDSIESISDLIWFRLKS